MKTAAHFIALAVLVGMVQGGSQALSRSLFASMIPRHRSPSSSPSSPSSKRSPASSAPLSSPAPSPSPVPAATPSSPSLRSLWWAGACWLSLMFPRVSASQGRPKRCCLTRAGNMPRVEDACVRTQGHTERKRDSGPSPPFLAPLKLPRQIAKGSAVCTSAAIPSATWLGFTLWRGRPGGQDALPNRRHRKKRGRTVPRLGIDSETSAARSRASGPDSRIREPQAARE